MNFSLLKELTIVILTYNRHKSLKRTIKYWLHYNVKLLILDGSQVKLEDSCLKSKNITYINNTKGIYARFLSTIDYIDTEFMILSCDDEFYLPTPLSSSINFLKNNPTFSCCGGCALGFGLTEENNFYGKERYSNLKNVNLNQDYAEERIQNHFSNYLPAHFYSVMRSSIWKTISKHVFVKEYIFHAALELQVEFLILVAGKTKIIPELMWMRNMNENIPIRGKDQSNRPSYAYTINDWWTDKLKKKDKEDFLYRMKNACEDLSRNTDTKFKEDQISKLYKLYINKVYTKKGFIKKFLNLILSKLKKLIKYILGLNKTVENKSIEDQAKVLEAQDISINYRELSQIILALKNSIIKIS